MEEQIEQHRRSPHDRDWWHAQAVRVFVLLASLSTLLIACSSLEQPLPALSSLHLPGVVQLDAVVNLEAKTGNHAIKSVLPYVSDRAVGKSAATHILYLGSGALYDIRLDGTGLRQLQMQPSCTFLGAIDTHGKHGLCWANRGLQAFDVNAADAVWTPRSLVVPTSTSTERFTSPSLAPDGQHVAALHLASAESPASIVIDAIDPAVTSAVLVAEVTLPDMHARRLFWSPDGKWLAFTTDETTSAAASGATYAFQLTTILPTLPTPSMQRSQPLQIALNRGRLVELEGQIDEANGWRPAQDGATWTYVDYGTIWQLNIVTGRRTALLTISDGAICTLAWTPDGKQLVFTQCRRAGISLPPPDRLYVYTPPA